LGGGSAKIYKTLSPIIDYGDKMSNEPGIKHYLDRSDSKFKHWIEIYLYADDGVLDRAKVVKKDSKPVYNESEYYFRNTDNGLVFRSGSKSCSGGDGDKSPSDEVVDLVNSLVEEELNE